MRTILKFLVLLTTLSGLNYTATASDSESSESFEFDSDLDYDSDGNGADLPRHDENAFNLQKLFEVLPTLEEQKYSADPVIMEVMGLHLTEQAQELAEKLRDKHRNEIDALASKAEFPDQEKINKLKAELAEKQTTYRQSLRDRQRVLREKVSELHGRVLRVNDLVAQYEEAKTSFENFGSCAEAKREQLAASVKNHLEKISQICDELISQVQRGKEIQDKVEQIIEGVQSGRHQSAREVQDVMDALTRYAEDKQAEIHRHQDDFEYAQRHFSQMVRDAQSEINSLQAELRDQDENINDTTQELRRIKDEMESISDRNSSRGADRYNSLVREYNNLLDHKRNQVNEYNRNQKECERRANALQGEINREKSRVKSQQRELNSFVSRANEKLQEKQKNTRKEIEELESEVNGELKQYKQDLKQIQGSLDSDYGPDYKKIIDGYNSFAEASNFQGASSIFNSIRRAVDYPKAGEAVGHFLAAQMGNNEILNLRTNLNQRFEHLKSIEDQIKGVQNIDSEKQVLITEEARIRSDADNHQKELDRLVDRINALYLKSSESEKGRVSQIIEILNLELKILTQEVNLIYAFIHISLAPSYIIGEAKESYHSAIGDLKARHDRDCSESIMRSCKTFNTGSDCLPSLCSQVRGIKGEEDLSYEKRSDFLKQWFNTLNQNSFFSECTGAICEFFKKDETSVKGFLANSFVHGFHDNSTVTKIKYDDSETGYRVTFNGRVYLVDEDGKLQYFDPKKTVQDFFEYSFVTSSKTPDGIKLRQMHSAVNMLFGTRWAELKEVPKFSALYALSLIQIADQLKSEQEQAARQEIIAYAEGFISLALGFTPAGPVIGLFEFLSGKDVFGNKISDAQRYIAVATSIGFHPKVLQLLKDKIGPVSSRFQGCPLLYSKPAKNWY